MSECDFCNEFTSGLRNAFAKRYGSHLCDQILVRTDRFSILPSLGQIVEGHLLIIPLDHFCALADMPSDQIRIVDDLCKQVRSILCDAYGACVLFEHGIRGEGSGGCGIDHAHMHAVPVAADGVLDALTQEFGGSSIHSLSDIKNRLDINSSYLLFEDASTRRNVFPVDNLPSQYMRRLVAESIGKSDWDWRACGREPELISTVQRLSPLFSPAATANRG